MSNPIYENENKGQKKNRKNNKMDLVMVMLHILTYILKLFTRAPALRLKPKNGYQWPIDISVMVFERQIVAPQTQNFDDFDHTTVNLNDKYNNNNNDHHNDFEKQKRNKLSMSIVLFD